MTFPESNENVQRSQALERQIEREWKCRLTFLGERSPIDYYATQDGTPIAIIEIRCRAVESGTYERVMLNCRKWLALMLGALGLGLPAYWVVGFTDQARYINVHDIDARAMGMGGRIFDARRWGTDYEPVVWVPVNEMHLLSEEAR